MIHPRTHWKIKKLTRGHAYGKYPGTYLNSQTWRYCGTIRARDCAEALQKAAYAVGSSLVQVEEI